EAELAAVFAEGEAGQGHAVEGGGFDDGVVAHVEEGDLVADGEGLVEAVVADDVAREAGGTAESVGPRFFARRGGVEHAGAVGHFQHVGHVGGGGHVEHGDEHVVLHNVND